MNIIPIAFAFDDNLVMPAGVCITSLLENAAPSTFYHIFILYDEHYDFSSSLLAQIPKVYSNCKLTFRKIRNVFDKAFEIRGITTPAYFRLLIPDLIPEYDKVLYSDVDVIFRDDLSFIYQEDLGDNYFGGVDVLLPLRPEIEKYVTNVIHLDEKKGYFYSGNLIINSALIRKDGLTAQFKKLAVTNFHFQDMDVINIICNGRIKSISPMFCMTNFLYTIIINRKNEILKFFSEEELKSILQKGLIHYNGAKPWKGWCYNQDIWWWYYRKSIFFTEKACCDFYTHKIEEIEKWSLLKRVKHVYRYFKR